MLEQHYFDFSTVMTLRAEFIVSIYYSFIYLFLIL